MVPLYIKTNYSLLSSLIDIKKLIIEATNQKITTLSIVDDNMYGVREFILLCEKNNIKPIIGLELKLENTVLLYAKNYNGYLNLCKLTTIQSERTPNINDLKEHSSDLICILPFNSKANYNEIRNIILDTYLGYSNSKHESIVKSITNDIVYLKKNLYFNNNDSEYLKYLYLIRDGKTISDEIEVESNLAFNDNSLDDICSLGIDNTIVISNKCNVVFPKMELLLPVYNATIDAFLYLKELAIKGLNKRFNNDVSINYKLRLDNELNIINKMGFCNYFLVVYDFIRFAKKNDILVGPGRGSAAGSLVSFCLGITDIDPLKYDLLFERFLNPERITMPDIDTDFPDIYRDKVIDYVTSKYGNKNVAGIVTFGTLSVKQAIRDVSRVLNIPLYKVDMLTKMIPLITKNNINYFYDTNINFKESIDDDEQLKRLYDIVKVIEGFPRHISSHAAGIVMCKKPLDEVLPLVLTENGYLTGYSMEYLEDLGLLKMDFLGLKNLTTIMDIISLAKKIYDVDINFNKITMDDAKTIDIFARADTLGIFQFESEGMQHFLEKLQPDDFNDIIAAIALFRPGPAAMIDTYIKRKKGLEKITYLVDNLESILASTYGIIIYQEQIMLIASLMANYSLGEADILRRAMGKKKLDILQNEQERFIKKSIAKGYSDNQAKEVYELILKFANYGFNKSHSVAYATISYKMAYLKAYYPLAFYTSLLTSVIGSEVKTKVYLNEIRKHKIKVKTPCITESTDVYQALNHEILFPLSNIKGVGMVATNEIIKARNDQKFSDIYQTFSSLVRHNISSKVIEILIHAGCFANFPYNMATLIHNFDVLYNYGELSKDLDESLIMKPEIAIVNEYSNSLLRTIEKDIYGFYITNHPTSIFRDNYKKCIKITDIEQFYMRRVSVLVLVDNIKVINTKKGDEMAFILGSDEETNIDLILFPDVFKKYQSLLIKGQVIKVEGKVEKRASKWQIVVDFIEKIEEETNNEKD